MTDEHRKYIEDNIIHFERVSHGYVKDADVNKFEEIYKEYIDPGFIVTKWCPACVFKMMERLKNWWEINK